MSDDASEGGAEPAYGGQCSIDGGDEIPRGCCKGDGGPGQDLALDAYDVQQVLGIGGGDDGGPVTMNSTGVDDWICGRHHGVYRSPAGGPALCISEQGGLREELEGDTDWGAQADCRSEASITGAQRAFEHNPRVGGRAGCEHVCDLLQPGERDGVSDQTLCGGRTDYRGPFGREEGCCGHHDLYYERPLHGRPV